MYGADVAPQGGAARLRLVQVEPANQAPVAALRASLDGNRPHSTRRPQPTRTAGIVSYDWYVRSGGDEQALGFRTLGGPKVEHEPESKIAKG